MAQQRWNIKKLSRCYGSQHWIQHMLGESVMLTYRRHNCTSWSSARLTQLTSAYVTLLHCPRLSQYDCCLPFPCIHAQTKQHCQHPHTASNLSNLTWAGQQSATSCLWRSRMKTTDVLRHLLVLQNPHLTIFCTYNKTFHCEVVLHACQSLTSSYDQ
jgi:hypothetical protein